MPDKGNVQKLFPSLDESKYHILGFSRRPPLLVAPLVLSFSYANPVPFTSLHTRTLCCASTTLDIWNLVVYGMLQLIVALILVSLLRQNAFRRVQPCHAWF